MNPWQYIFRNKKEMTWYEMVEALGNFLDKSQGLPRQADKVYEQKIRAALAMGMIKENNNKYQLG